jgi:hypothetical protein
LALTWPNRRWRSIVSEEALVPSMEDLLKNPV